MDSFLLNKVATWVVIAKERFFFADQRLPGHLRRFMVAIIGRKYRQKC
ncbi:hypothetical protein [Candidatus Promineifilum breve]|nr:hypothetical protein [Candidatus Promineifilum breve]